MSITLLGLLGGAGVAFLTLTLVYYVIRFSVRDGVIDAQRKIDADRVRSDLRLGAERSPNSRG